MEWALNGLLSFEPFQFQILDYLGKSSDTDSSSPDQTLLTRTRWPLLSR